MKKLLSSPLVRLIVGLVVVVIVAGGIAITKKQNVLACDSQTVTEKQIAEFRGIAMETMQLLQTQRGLAPREICEMPQAALDRAIKRAYNPNSDRPDEALAFRRLQLQDENGFIPPDGISKANEQIRAMLALQDVNREAAGIVNGSWKWLGPGNIGGRVRSILIHPTNANIMWAGSVSGGIWKTTNGGASWQILDDFLANMAVATLVMDPANPNIIYAGTGEGFYNGDGIQGAGIFKTTNGGASWMQLPATSTSNWYYVNRLDISPTGGIILAATSTGIWRSTDGGVTWNQQTTDRVLDINFNPSNSAKAIAGGSYGQSWYSTDSGVTWKLSNGLPALDWLGRVEVAYSKSKPNIVYASVGANSGEVWKSIDGGATYSLVRTGDNYLGSQGWYDNIIWVDPLNASHLIVGGIDLWRSTNGGASFTKISQWWSAPNSAHADQHMIIQPPGYDGSTNKRLFFGNDGGVYRVNDISQVTETTGWLELNNNLGITQFYGAAGNPTTGKIIGGTQDNGTLLYTPGSNDTEKWITTYGGDGGFSGADPVNPNYFYGEYVNLQIFRSSDGGVSAEDIYGGYWYWNGASWEMRWKKPPYRIEDAKNGTANFIATFILDPNNSNRLLAGGLNLWRTDDVKTANTDTAGPSWASIKPSNGVNISAIAVAIGNSDIIWVGHNDGSVYMTSNGTSATPIWTRVDTNGLPNRYVTRITIDKHTPSTVYVTFGGFSPDNVWRTTTSGSSWTDATGSGLTGLPDVPVRSLAIHPNNSNWLYVGTETGIFSSEDAGATWSVPHDGPTNTSVDELFWMNTTLVAATHGRGMFKATVVTNDDFDASAVISQVPFTDNLINVTNTATSAFDDPAFVACKADPGLATVWYQYVPSANSRFHIDTVGSDYDTVLGVWTGSRGSLSAVACNNDIVAGSNVQSQVDVTLTAGTVYYIEVAEFRAALDAGQSDTADLVRAQTANGTLKLNIKRIKYLTTFSQAVSDGYILESTETSGSGGSLDSAGATLVVGDDAQDRQYRSILSFNTGGLPDTAIVTRVTLKIKQKNIIGTNPFTTHSNLMVDAIMGSFSGNAAVQLTDFRAAASRANAGGIPNLPVNNWYTKTWTGIILPYINTSGLTQLRLRFQLDDDNNSTADYIAFFSGDYGVAADRPQLVIEYYLP